MKYIRTKYGIYKLIWDIIEKNGKKYIIEKYDGCILEKEVLKQADTIEELCDEFVAIHKTLKATYCIQKMPFEKQDENFNIYGAIWTDKGLIFVAKMNEKGELELI